MRVIWGELHFDVRQYNILKWQNEDSAKFAERLRYRIEVIVGKKTESV